jgi:hypothetical protein
LLGTEQGCDAARAAVVLHEKARPSHCCCAASLLDACCARCCITRATAARQEGRLPCGRLDQRFHPVAKQTQSSWYGMCEGRSEQCCHGVPTPCLLLHQEPLTVPACRLHQHPVCSWLGGGCTALPPWSAALCMHGSCSWCGRSFDPGAFWTGGVQQRGLHLLDRAQPAAPCLHGEASKCSMWLACACG